MFDILRNARIGPIELARYQLCIMFHIDLENLIVRESRR
jgi:hypothetical protein